MSVAGSSVALVAREALEILQRSENIGKNARGLRESVVKDCVFIKNTVSAEILVDISEFGV